MQVNKSDVRAATWKEEGRYISVYISQADGLARTVGQIFDCEEDSCLNHKPLICFLLRKSSEACSSAGSQEFSEPRTHKEVVIPGNVWVKLRADADTLHEELAVFCAQLAKAEESQNTFTVYQLPDFL